jgi:hypothetical protein
MEREQNLDYTIEGTKNVFVEQLTTGEGRKFWATEQFTTTWGT